MQKNVVVTGIGVIAPNGIGKNAFWKSLENGKSGIKPISLFNAALFKAKSAGECTDFVAEEFLGKKGLRNLDRSTKLLCSSVKLALDDANLEITDDNTDDIGVVTATTLSVSGDIVAFTKEVVEDGPGRANPALFPLTTMNFPSSQVAIRFKIEGFNTTISTGYSAGLDAIKYAADLINSGKVKAVVVSGVESLSFSTFVGLYKIGFLAGLKGQELSCPFDKRHNGIVFGEGAGTILLEDEEYAKKRKADVYARVNGVECCFDGYRASKYHPQASGLKLSMVRVIDKSLPSEATVDYICAAANSYPQQDNLEAAAIKDVFNIYTKEIPVSSIKSMIGESVSASGLLQVAASVGVIRNNFIPANLNFNEPDTEYDLSYPKKTVTNKDIKNVLVNNFGPGGNNSTAIISKYEQ